MKMVRITIKTLTKYGESSSPLDLHDYPDFIKYLSVEGITKFDLKYRSILDDIPDFYETELTPDIVKESHFEWLITKSYGDSKYLEITYQNKPITKEPNKMKITDSKGNAITKLEEWKHFIFENNKKEKHWKEGRSAYSLADFIIRKNGEVIIRELISKILSEEVTLLKAIPEEIVAFDEFKHGREHDLAIEGITQSKKTVFIGVEAKVDEPFNQPLIDAYLEAKSEQLSGKSTNKPERIEKLIQRNFKVIDPSIFKLKYQLLYSTVGTLAKNADISILLILVFQTKDYDPIKGIENYKNYLQFIQKVESQKIMIQDTNATIHKLNVDEKELWSVYMEM